MYRFVVNQPLGTNAMAMSYHGRMALDWLVVDGLAMS